MTTRLLLVRHGQTSYNAKTRFTGQLDIPLDAIGRAQAQAVAIRLMHEQPAAIYFSGLSRTFDTAEAIRTAIASRCELLTDARLTEGSLGEWEGKTYASTRVQDGERWAAWQGGATDIAPPGGETVQEIADRALAALDNILMENEGKTVIIVAHRGPIQVMITSALGLPLEQHRRFVVSNAGVSELQVDDRGAVLHVLNDTCHLREA